MANAGSFKKGEKKPNQGKRGQDRVQRDVREAILLVADGLGGHARMLAWVKEDPKNEQMFWGSIYPKLMPKEVKAEVVATHLIQRLTPEQLAGIVEAVAGGR